MAKRHKGEEMNRQEGGKHNDMRAACSLNQTRRRNEEITRFQLHMIESMDDKVNVHQWA